MLSLFQMGKHFIAKTFKLIGEYETSDFISSFMLFSTNQLHERQFIYSSKGQ